MKEHKGMRPQDICILLKIITIDNKEWYNKDLASELAISNSEVSESLHRSLQAQLIDGAKRRVIRHNLMEFLAHGMKYVFPEKPGPLATGVAAAHSAPPLNDLVASEVNYVWSHDSGKARGLAIKPLYRTVPEAALKDVLLYELLSLVDALRIGRLREEQTAIEELQKRII